MDESNIYDMVENWINGNRNDVVKQLLEGTKTNVARFAGALLYDHGMKEFDTLCKMLNNKENQ